MPNSPKSSNAQCHKGDIGDPSKDRLTIRKVLPCSNQLSSPTVYKVPISS